MLLFAGAAIVVLTTANGASAIQGSAPPSTVQAQKVLVPHVVPKTLEVAIRKARAARLQPVGISLPLIVAGDLGLNGYAAVSQRPRAGSRVAIGASVLLRISVSVNGGSGGNARQGFVTVPYVTGLNIDKAIHVALLAGLRVTVPSVHHRLRDFAVRRQGLRVGRTVRAGSIITLVVAD
ncbi:MAG TPA: PASTA domain-containing protein [Gaiellaceae bacterium]